MALLIIVISVLCLAYANGANDNFKGVATLFGSGTTNYRRALAWATITTFLGSLTAVVLAEKLRQSFSGKGLVAEELVASAEYGAAVALGAGLTVLLATRIGMPISTTHGLVGALVGSGLAAGSAINFGKLGGGFFLPLLVSPLLALLVTMICYPGFRWMRTRLGVTYESCVCIETEAADISAVPDGAVALERAQAVRVTVGDAATCAYRGRVLGIEAAWALNGLHYLSAGVVSYARGLNDTPKIAAMLFLAPQLAGWGSTALVGMTIALGGIFSAKRVAETMSQKITEMNHGQGFTANLVTGVIVIGASGAGLPVSTTHVSCGSLFGIGTLTGKAQFGMIGKILAAWVTTLPLGAALGALSYWLIRSVL